MPTDAPAHLRRSPPSIELRIAVALALGCLILWAVPACLTDLWGPDEGRYTQIAKELLGRRNWLLLTLQGQPYDQKPPLAFWLWAGIVKLCGGGVVAGALRLPAALFSALTTVATFFIGLRLWGTRRGVLAALALMATPLMADHAASVGLDAIFAGWTALAFWIWLASPDRAEGVPLGWPRAAALWGALAGAFFTKGPLAILIFILVVGTEAALARSLRVFRAVRPVTGLTVVGALAGVWFWAQRAGAGAEFVHGQIVGETVGRFLHGDHAQPPWFYLEHIPIQDFFPSSIPLAVALVMAWRSRRTLDPALRPILIWAVLPVALLSLSHGKRDSYLMPMVPAFALLSAWPLDLLLERGAARPKVARGFGLLAVALAAGVVAAAVTVALAPWLVWNHRFYATRAELAAVAVVALALGGLGWRASRRRAELRPLLELAVGATLIVFLVRGILLRPAINDNRSCRPFALRMAELAARSGEPPAAVGAVDKAADAEYHVYGNYGVQKIDEQDPIFETPERLPDLMIAREDDRKVPGTLVKCGFEQVLRSRAGNDVLLVYRRVPAGRVAPPPRAWTFETVGDTGAGSAHEFNMVRQMEAFHLRQPIDAVILLGDNLYGENSFEVQIKKAFEEPFAPLLERKVPFYAILGNHDARHIHRQQEIDYPPFNLKGSPWLRADFGDGLVSFFGLESEYLLTDPAQTIWLRRQLEDCRSQWKVLMLHEPLLASEASHGSANRLRKLLAPLIKEYRVEIVLAGHNHFYERRNVADGVLHITAGAGSQPHKRPLPPDPNRAAAYPDDSSFLWMKFDGPRLEAGAIGEEGNRVDAFTALRRDAPPGVTVTTNSEAIDKPTNKPPSKDADEKFEE